jgi:hypothetical protein
MKSMARIRQSLASAGAILLLALIQAAAWADVAPIPPLKQLDGATKAKVLAALAGLIILGFGMVALIWLGARVTQRYRKGTSYFQPTPRPTEHDWARKPLADDSQEPND